MAKGRRYTTAVFYRRDSKELQPLVSLIPSGFKPDAQRAQLANNDHAFDNGYTHWVQWHRYTAAPTPEGPPRDVEKWLIFKCLGRASSRLLHEMPTQASAEMWLVHHG